MKALSLVAFLTISRDLLLQRLYRVEKTDFGYSLCFIVNRNVLLVSIRASYPLQQYLKRHYSQCAFNAFHDLVRMPYIICCNKKLLLFERQLHQDKEYILEASIISYLLQQFKCAYVFKCSVIFLFQCLNQVKWLYSMCFMQLQYC